MHAWRTPLLFLAIELTVMLLCGGIGALIGLLAFGAPAWGFLAGGFAGTMLALLAIRIGRRLS